jgi:hypothetical protein
MASRRKYRQKYKRWAKKYERLAYLELQRTFHTWSKNINWSKLDKTAYRMQIEMTINTELLRNSYTKIYTGIGFKHGDRVGRSINLQLKEYTTEKFRPSFLKNLKKFFKKYGVSRITSIEDTYLDDITHLLSTRLDKGLTIEQAQREVRKIVSKPNFYRAQALRIARTETTAAANFAATEAGSVSGFKMQKEWISALDSRTRDDHSRTNGQRVAENTTFNVGGEKLRFPGDPRGSAGNVINCRCTVAMIPVRDSGGNLIPTN